jgi:hypothetical protein
VRTGEAKLDAARAGVDLLGSAGGLLLLVSMLAWDALDRVPPWLLWPALTGVVGNSVAFLLAARGRRGLDRTVLLARGLLLLLAVPAVLVLRFT